MKKYAFLLFLPLVALAFVRPAHPAANRTYVQFKGTKQGLFKGAAKGASGKEDQGWFEVESFSFGSANTANGGSGGGGGKETKQPSPRQIVISKNSDASSPLLHSAVLNNEMLETVVIELAGRPASGQGEIVAERITLTNGQIVHYDVANGKESLIIRYDQMTDKK